MNLSLKQCKKPDFTVRWRNILLPLLPVLLLAIVSGCSARHTAHVRSSASYGQMSQSKHSTPMTSRKSSRSYGVSSRGKETPPKSTQSQAEVLGLSSFTPLPSKSAQSSRELKPASKPIWERSTFFEISNQSPR